ncbi:cytochrome c [Sphingomonas sp. KRR8]|uniref:c-type cytochrome n=1 Tax=Sphingomonas sp. KRR8 TaxID=2942996 RepID=UPI002021407E|nr:cytochrome c [Sphingomonas sp. KRR8]URD62038.1 cytochrome c [Sphingomonas sp. KRR8]
MALFLILMAAFGGIFIYAGIYNIGADAPHSQLVYGLLRQLRERAIARQSSDIVAPKDLATPARIEAGAGLYQEMCTSCHLGPGVEPSELSQGLYPAAPNLTTTAARSAAQQFWIIKHGVKLSAMPAWGKTHNDELIWDMVAFIRQLPKMSPKQYRAAIASAPADHDEIMTAHGMDTEAPVAGPDHARQAGHGEHEQEHEHEHSAEQVH